MAKPIVHAESSARKYGGDPMDYFPIHDFLDNSKGAIPDNRHRALTHNSWFLSNVLEKIHIPEVKWFGPYLINSEGRKISVREIGEQHILEDFKGVFIPTAADYLMEMEIKSWMNNGADGDAPPSHKKLVHKVVSRKEHLQIRVD